MGSMPQNVGFQARGGMMNTMRGSGMNFRGHRGGVMGMPMNMGMGSMGIGAGMQSMRGMGLGGMSLRLLSSLRRDRRLRALWIH